MKSCHCFVGANRDTVCVCVFVCVCLCVGIVEHRTLVSTSNLISCKQCYIFTAFVVFPG
jgi:hypothetical protein